MGNSTIPFEQMISEIIRPRENQRERESDKPFQQMTNDEKIMSVMNKTQQ